VHGLDDFRVEPVKVGLFRGEKVEIVFLCLLVPFPSGT